MSFLSMFSKSNGKCSKEDKISRMPKDTYLAISDFFKEEDIAKKEVVIICIGANRTEMVDCLAPYVGSLLKEDKDFEVPVYGTMVSPINAVNLTQRMTEIKNLHPRSTIIAVDASLGDEDRIGRISVSNKPIIPRQGVESICQSVGDYSIKGCVAKVGTDLIQYGGDLKFISAMAYVIAKGLKEIFS